MLDLRLCTEDDICERTCVHVCACVHAYAPYVRMSTCVHVCLCVHVYACECVCTHVRVYVHVCVYVCVCVCDDCI